jgi:hypothetical protein
MYFPDLTPYTYGKRLAGPDLLNVGWLDEHHPFPTGKVPEPLLARILHLRATIDLRTVTLGIHSSPFIQPRQRGGYPVTYRGNTLHLGSAEIRVPGAGGIVYAAPDLIYHYIKDCRYLPPKEFLKALAALPEPDR